MLTSHSNISISPEPKSGTIGTAVPEIFCGLLNQKIASERYT
jgi:hypothetical protein